MKRMERRDALQGSPGSGLGSCRGMQRPVNEWMGSHSEACSTRLAEIGEACPTLLSAQGPSTGEAKHR